MSALIAVSALTSFAFCRSNSNGVFAPREVGKPPPEAVAVEEVEDVERGDLQVAADRRRAPAVRGFVVDRS